ncbi:MAG: deoxyhypusine synthase family protein [Desulfobacteraceae bacterium]|nr:deoxyhypusine synthase family protein [Desulfobacteraceae bacterium]
MKNIKDFTWKQGMTVQELMQQYQSLGYQSIELSRVSEVFVKMKKNSAKILLTFTSNMVTSGLRGFFAQVLKKGMADIVVTTVGGIEEDIMKAMGETFRVGDFEADDVDLHEKGKSRVGNILIHSESYLKLEDALLPILKKLYKKKPRWAVSEMLREIGLMLDDENSILATAAKYNIPIFCPAITDGAFGFHLYLFQRKHPDFVIDVVKDFGNILFSVPYDDKKGVIALGGSISKHHAILLTLINGGGAEYAAYITTAHKSSGSMSGANTNEAKSWGKVKDSADVATAIGDVTILFPLAMINAMEELQAEGLLREE